MCHAGTVPYFPVGLTLRLHATTTQEAAPINTLSRLILIITFLVIWKLMCFEREAEVKNQMKTPDTLWWSQSNILKVLFAYEIVFLEGSKTLESDQTEARSESWVCFLQALRTWTSYSFLCLELRFLTQSLAIMISRLHGCWRNYDGCKCTQLWNTGPASVRDAVTKYRSRSKQRAAFFSSHMLRSSDSELFLQMENGK